MSQVSAERQAKRRGETRRSHRIYLAVAVAAFFQNHGNKYNGLYKYVYFRDLSSGFYNKKCSASGYVIPEISAQALNFRFILQGKLKDSTDKSSAGPVRLPCSVPSLSTWQTANILTVAGVISLLDDLRFSQGKHPLGFLNTGRTAMAARA